MVFLGTVWYLTFGRNIVPLSSRQECASLVNINQPHRTVSDSRLPRMSLHQYNVSDVMQSHSTLYYAQVDHCILRSADNARLKQAEK